jgi:hypothetical protein
MVCYINRGDSKSTYPKCEACGLAGHAAEKCYPLIFFCIAQAFASQHPDVLRKIKASYKQFPCNARTRTPRKVTVKQIVAFLDPPAVKDIPVPIESSAQHVSDFVNRLDFDDPQLFHCKFGTALVTYKDQLRCTNTQESPAQTFLIKQTHVGPFVIFSEASSIEHSVNSVHPQLDMLVDTGSTITTMVTNGELSSYVKPSTSGIKMRSATGELVLPAGEGDVTLQAEQASLVIKFQHTPAIGSNILSPAETCDTLDYDLYSLTCNRHTSPCQVLFAKRGSPDITLQGTYSHRVPYIWLASSLAAVTSVVPMTYNFSSVTEESLSDDNDDAVHQVMRLLHYSSPTTTSTPSDCRFSMFQVFGEKISDDWTHGGNPDAPVMHVSDVVNRTLWHMRTCHPSPARLVLLSKLAKGMPKIKHPRDIEERS